MWMYEWAGRGLYVCVCARNIFMSLHYLYDAMLIYYLLICLFIYIVTYVFTYMCQFVIAFIFHCIWHTFFT